MYIKLLLITLALASLACQSAGTIITTTPTESQVAGTSAPVTVALLPTSPSGCIQAKTDLHIRAEPRETAAILSVLYADQTAQVVGRAGEWTQIVGGYVKTKYTEQCK